MKQYTVEKPKQLRDPNLKRAKQNLIDNIKKAQSKQNKLSSILQKMSKEEKNAIKEAQDALKAAKLTGNEDAIKKAQDALDNISRPATKLSRERAGDSTSANMFKLNVKQAFDRKSNILADMLREAEDDLNNIERMTTERRKYVVTSLSIIYRNCVIRPDTVPPTNARKNYQWQYANKYQPWSDIGRPGLDQIKPELTEGKVRLHYNDGKTEVVSNVVDIGSVLKRAANAAKRKPYKLNQNDPAFRQRCIGVAGRILRLTQPRVARSDVDPTQSRFSMRIFQDRVSKLPGHLNLSVADIIYMCEQCNFDDEDFIKMIEFVEPTIHLDPDGLRKEVKRIKQGKTLVLALGPVSQQPERSNSSGQPPAPSVSVLESDTDSDTDFGGESKSRNEDAQYNSIAAKVAARRREKAKREEAERKRQEAIELKRKEAEEAERKAAEEERKFAMERLQEARKEAEAQRLAEQQRSQQSSSTNTEDEATDADADFKVGDYVTHKGVEAKITGETDDDYELTMVDGQKINTNDFDESTKEKFDEAVEAEQRVEALRLAEENVRRKMAEQEAERKRKEAEDAAAAAKAAEEERQRQADEAAAAAEEERKRKEAEDAAAEAAEKAEREAKEKADREAAEKAAAEEERKRKEAEDAAAAAAAKSLEPVVGARVKSTTKTGDYVDKEGVITKVNPRSVNVQFDGESNSVNRKMIQIEVIAPPPAPSVEVPGALPAPNEEADTPTELAVGVRVECTRNGKFLNKIGTIIKRADSNTGWRVQFDDVTKDVFVKDIDLEILPDQSVPASGGAGESKEAEDGPPAPLFTESRQYQIPSGALAEMVANMSDDWASSEDELGFAEESDSEELGSDQLQFAESSAAEHNDSGSLEFAESSAIETDSDNDIALQSTSEKTSSGLEFAESSAVESDSARENGSSSGLGWAESSDYD